MMGVAHIPLNKQAYALMLADGIPHMVSNKGVRSIDNVGCSHILCRACTYPLMGVAHIPSNKQAYALILADGIPHIISNKSVRSVENVGCSHILRRTCTYPQRK